MSKFFKKNCITCKQCLAYEVKKGFVTLYCTKKYEGVNNYWSIDNPMISRDNCEHYEEKENENG